MTTGGCRVEGVAHRSDGEPVSEARVFFTAAPVDVPDIALLTDDEGRFSLVAPVPGHYELACYAEGLVPATVAFDVTGGAGIVRVDIELQPESD